MDQLESLAPSVPSLIDCTSLTVKGPVRFEGGVAIRGDVTLTNGEFGVCAVAACSCCRWGVRVVGPSMSTPR